jgi:hypothetical protein
MKLMALLFLALSAAAGAQNLCVTVSPNPAPQGAPITISGFAVPPGGLYTQSACWVPIIHSGTPNGPVIQALPCAFVPTAIPGCGSALPPRTYTWTPPPAIAPGLYWFQINWVSTPFGAVTSEFFDVTLQGVPAGPVLSAAGAATWGSPFFLSLAAPLHPGEAYAVALSGSTNTGIAIGPGLFVSLDADPIFNLTFPNPDPLTFVAFQGVLDSSGNAGGIGILIPPLFLGCFPLHAQAAVVSAGGSLALSNELSFTVL